MVIHLLHISTKFEVR